MNGLGVQSFAAVFVVLGLVVALAWLMRRGAFNALRTGARSISVETAVPLGERRSLVIVAVEGRRLLLGMTPSQISMVTELDAAPPVPEVPLTPGGGNPSFEQQLASRARDLFTRRPSSGSQSLSPAGDILKLSVQEP